MDKQMTISALSDEGTVAEAIDSRAFSEFCCVDSSNQVPDGDTLGRFREITVRVPLIPGFVDAASQEKSAEKLMLLRIINIDTFTYLTDIKSKTRMCPEDKSTDYD